MSKKVFILGDLHLPFHCKKSLKLIYDHINLEKPNVVVQIGDLYDMYSMSRFPKDPSVIKPKDEIYESYELAVDMWETIRSIVPRGTFYQIMGNHMDRPMKLALEKAPELFPLVAKSWKDLVTFKGVNTIYDNRDDLEIDGVIYEHGFYGKPGMHLRENMKCTVYGHTHSAKIIYEKIRGKLLWELNVGFLADEKHKALSYTRNKYVKWTKGFGLVENKIPMFIPLD